MANSGKIAPRAFPPYFEHPRSYKQLTKEEFATTPRQSLEENAGLCAGHKKTIIHLAGFGENRRYILQVILDKGSFFIESPCTFTPGMGMDILDANLAKDAEEWILVQHLRKKPKRLRIIFGNQDRLPCNDYIKVISLPHVADDSDYEDDDGQGTPVSNTNTTSTPTSMTDKKKWWKFW